jgi:hypothetical protein
MVGNSIICTPEVVLVHRLSGVIHSSKTISNNELELIIIDAKMHHFATHPHV